MQIDSEDEELRHACRMWIAGRESEGHLGVDRLMEFVRMREQMAAERTMRRLMELWAATVHKES
jgi:hypothetical protein